MPESDDIALLRQYAEGNSESAFATLVEKYVNLVYSTALRSAGNAHAAEEITHAVSIGTHAKPRANRNARGRKSKLTLDKFRSSARHIGLFT